MINQEGQNNGIRTHSDYLKSYSRESSKDGDGNGNDDTQVLIQRHYHSDDNYNIESFNDTIQKQRSNSKLFIQDNIDTQDDQMGDTQIIRKPLPDTQIIGKALSDTQVINNALPDTQVIGKVLPDTQIIQKVLPDTQVIKRHYLIHR